MTRASVKAAGMTPRPAAALVQPATRTPPYIPGALADLDPPRCNRVTADQREEAALAALVRRFEPALDALFYAVAFTGLGTVALQIALACLAR